MSEISVPQRRVGRPPRAIPNDVVIVKMADEVYETIGDLADRLGMTWPKYAEHVVAAAFDYEGPYLQVDVDLHMAMSREQLQARVIDFRAEDLLPCRIEYTPRTFRLDRPLALMLAAHAAHFGPASKASLVRALLTTAVGADRPGRGVQTPLSLELSGGVGRRRSA